MTLGERIEREIYRNGATVVRRPLFGLQAVSVTAGNKKAVFVDTEAFSGASEVRSAEAHECGHIATASTHSFDASPELIGKQELTANRWAVHKFLPFRKIKKAMLSGYTEAWQLAEYFDFDERFIRTALYVYQIEGLYADLQSGRSEGRPSEV